MSLVDGISGTFGNRSTLGASNQSRTRGPGSMPGAPNASQNLANRFGAVFQTSFSRSMATVFQRGALGDFDDPTLALQERAALERLRQAEQSVSGSTTTMAKTPRAAVQGGGGHMVGANAAPDAVAMPPGPSVTISHAPSVTTGTNSASTASGPVAVAEQRELHSVRVRQSEARLANISSSLRADFPAASRLASASTGWDPETFVPKTRAEAQAFAQRMVIDATESAARLEIVKTQLDAATFEARATGAPEATALAAQLQADFDRQKTYVDKLARIVDTAAGGSVTDKGSAAMRGHTQRDAGDLPIDEMVDALRSAGMSEGQIARTVGASELGVEQEKTPGGSETLRTVARSSADWTWQNRFNLQEARRSESRRIEARREQERTDEADKHESERSQDRHREQKQAFNSMLESRAAERSARDHAQLQAYLSKIDAQRQAARRAG